MSVAALQAVALRAALARGDEDLARRFFRTAGLLESPGLLLRPSTLLRVLAGNLRPGGASATGATTPTGGRYRRDRRKQRA